MQSAQLNPGENFPVSWQIADPNDATTYYPQATIYNAVNNKLLTTLNLAAVAGVAGLYSVNYPVPQDPTGTGSYINLILTVYTDADHTTKSPNYNIESRIYLIMQRLNFSMIGGGSSVDYEKIKQIVKDQKPKDPKLLGSIDEGIRSLLGRVSKHHTHLSQLLTDQLGLSAKTHEDGLATLSEAIGGVDKKLLPGSVLQSLSSITEYLQQFGTTMTGILDLLNTMNAQVGGMGDLTTQNVESSKKVWGEVLPAVRLEVGKQLAAIMDKLDEIDRIVMVQKNMPEKSSRKPDYADLAARMLR